MTPFVAQTLMTIRALYAENEGLLSDDALRMDAIEGETQAFEAMDWLIRKDREETALMNAMDELIARYKDRKDRASARKEAGRDMMQALLQAIGETKIKRPAASVSLNPPKWSTKINAEELPQGFYKNERKPLATEINAALAAGETIPGVERVRGQPFITVI